MTYPSDFDRPRNRAGSPRWTADRVNRLHLTQYQTALVLNIIEKVREYEKSREPITEDVVMCTPEKTAI